MSSPQPLQVTLVNGVVCNLTLHGQAQHYQNRRGWIWCSNDGSKALLTDVATGTRCFDTSKPQWTAQYDVGQNPPTTLGVRRVVYAQ